ncbi:hypothetical protein M8044_000079 [Columbia Basin potato purple top phytoplasma]|uniref:Uncharacterized protein n=1 Tax=Columbia Basin potato purple top phytoplasma TaxID=307134 RepID=A0ABT5L854_9MOLU|nr:hypothetical protein [Columbia Basin potato purple top phytoplasma]
MYNINVFVIKIYKENEFLNKEIIKIKNITILKYI